MATIQLPKGTPRLRSLLSNAHEWLRPRCDICSSRLFRLVNYKNALSGNHAEAGKVEADVGHATFICGKCFLAKRYSRCCKTLMVFHSKDDRSGTFRSSQMQIDMSPHHPSSHLSGPLSPEGLAAISREYTEMCDLLASWAGGTKQEFLRGFTIDKVLGVIREEGRFSAPLEIEVALKRHSVQIGGNGFIKFFWDKHEQLHSEQYVAGYGHKGNPYYRNRTRRETWFTGHAVCVRVKSIDGSRKDRRSNGGESNRRSDNGSGAPKSESDYLRILGVTGSISREAIRRGYRVSMMQYHPDKVAHLGPALRELAEAKAKEINEAYAFFQLRYGY